MAKTHTTTIIRNGDPPGAFDKCRRLLAACSLCSNPPNVLAMVNAADAELDKLEADARALWAVRVLWRHAVKHGTRHSFGASVHLESGAHAVSSVMVGATCEQGGLPQYFGKLGLTEAEGVVAMIAAAEALVTADPSLGVGL